MTQKTCPDCNGDGVIEKGTDDERQCPTCGGSGFVPDDNDDNEEVIRTGKGCKSGGAVISEQFCIVHNFPAAILSQG